MNRLSGLYVITDEELSPGRTHAEIAAAAVEGGARIIQIRDKKASDRDFYNAALQIRKLTAEAGVLFIVNDRVDVAAAVKADGVNVGRTDLPVPVARKLLGNRALVGMSADDLDQARQADIDGADYLGFGPVFPTSTKLDAGPVSGLEMLENVCKLIDVPVVAIGGIGAANIGSVAAAGAACAAVVSAVVCAEDMVKATAELVAQFEKASVASPKYC